MLRKSVKALFFDKQVTVCTRKENKEKGVVRKKKKLAIARKDKRKEQSECLGSLRELFKEVKK